MNRTPSSLPTNAKKNKRNLKIKFRLQEFHAKITATKRAIGRELERDDRGPISGHWRRSRGREKGGGEKSKRGREVSRLLRRLARGIAYSGEFLAGDERRDETRW